MRLLASCGQLFCITPNFTITREIIKMKIVACIFAILSGIFGLFSGTVQSIFGAGIGMLSGNDNTMNNGVLVFYLSWIVIILGGLSLKFPKQSGIGLILISIASFTLGNIFSAPFVFIAGIFDLFDASGKKTLINNEIYQPNITSRGADFDKKVTSSDNKIIDKVSLLNQLTQLHDLKEKNVITDDMYEKERQFILSKFKTENLSESAVANEIIPEIISSSEETTIVHDEIYSSEYTELFTKNKWYKKPALWLITIGFVLIVGIWVFSTLHKKALPAPYSNTLVYRIDTLIRNVDINGEIFSITVLRDKFEDPLVKPKGRDELSPEQSPITVIITKSNDENPIYIKKFDFKPYDLLYSFSKGHRQNLDSEGKLYLMVSKSSGGSGSESDRYLIDYENGKIKFNHLFSSGELAYRLYNINDNEIIVLEGLWNINENESHFASHRYLISRYFFKDRVFQKTEIGRTKFKYSSLDEDKTSLEILTDIKTKEPILLDIINISDYKFN